MRFTPAHPAVRPRTRAIRDLIVTGAGTAAMLGIAAAIDLAEMFEDFAAGHEQWELDELPFALAITALGLAWFAIARWRDYSSQVKETNRQRELAEKAAAEANRANETKSMFLANMSHEIRTPMNGVRGMVNLLAETQLTSDQEKLVKSARESADALLRIINDILDISKLDAGHLHLESKDFSPDSTVDAVFSILGAEASAKNLTLTCDPQSDAPAWIRSDPLRLRQLLTNLVANAIKFTMSGGVSVLMKHRELSDSRLELYVAVTDTGIGIDSENIGRVFKPFAQADGSTTRKYGGTGLGLSICKQLAEAMGGRIGARSEVNVGSTFWFTIVCEKGCPVEPALSEATEIETDKPRELRVLLVEDNPTNQILAAAVLEKGGYSHDIANNGLEALEALKSSSYDLVLMDIQMPEMDGIEATKRIRQMNGASQQTPIIAVTANAMDGDREKYLAAGMNDYVPKPIDIGELIAAIERNLDRKGVVNGSGTAESDARSVETELPILDKEVIAKWQSFLSSEKFDQLVETQLSGAKDYTERLEQAARRGAIDDMRSLAHDLKGAGGNIGMARVEKLAAEIEQACIEGHDAEALDKLPCISEAFAAASAALQQLDRGSMAE